MSSEDQNDRSWDKKVEYFLSCVGLTIGLGHVWRFPYMVYKNGGGAFLIPYIIMIALVGAPVMLLEIALGQFSSLRPTSVWKFNPLFRGVGFCMVAIIALVSIYYNVINAYTIVYLFSSLTADLPWKTCDNFWNNQTTCSTVYVAFCNALNLSKFGEDEVNKAMTGFKAHTSFVGSGPVYTNVKLKDAEVLSNNLGIANVSSIGCTEVSSSRLISPSEEFWVKYVLHLAPRIDPEFTGNVNSGLALSLLLVWIIVFFSLIKGVKSFGKVAYFTSLFPYVAMIAFVVKGATLPGAWEGIQFYIGSQSDVTKLSNANVWKDAVTQAFYSLSIGFSGLIALSSYNKFNNNCVKDTVYLCIINVVTSIIVGFAIFTVLGHMASTLKTPVDEVVRSSFGLAYVVYPEAIAQLPLSTVWSILFFLMFFTMGMGASITYLEVISSALIDSFPQYLRSRQLQTKLFTSIVLYLLSLVCVTDTGNYWVDLIDHYLVGWCLLFAIVLELIGVCYVYGGNRFIEDIEMMIGKKSQMYWLYWKICWFFISPLLLMSIMIWSLITFTGVLYDDDTPFPVFANVLGWLMTAAVIGMIPFFAIVSLFSHKSLFKACSPEPDWGPYLVENRGTRYANIQDSKEVIEMTEYNAKKKLNNTENSNAGYCHDEESEK